MPNIRQPVSDDDIEEFKFYVNNFRAGSREQQQLRGLTRRVEPPRHLLRFASNGRPKKPNPGTQHTL